jgi:putative membrane protein
LTDPAPGPVVQGRLHPCTLVILVVNALRNFVLPAIFVFATGSQASLGLLLLAFLGLHLAQALVRYFTFTYRLEAAELITRQGILHRQERIIPLVRVQDVRLDQGVIQRLLRVVEVHVETAGGRGAEASLCVLGRAEAEALRRAVFDQASRPLGEPRTAPAGPAPGEIVRRLGLRDLVWEGLTSNRAASVLVLLAAGWQFLDDLVPQAWRQRWAEAVAGQVERWANAGAHTGWLAMLAAGVAVVLVTTAFSVAGSLVLLYNFTLARRGEDLQRSYGLLTRRASSLPRRRIQVLKIEEPWLRRLFRLVTLRADTAGSQPTDPAQGKEGRDVLLPIARRDEVEPLIPVFFPDFDAPPAVWQRVSPRAVWRGTKKGCLGVLALALASGWAQRSVLGLWPLLLWPLVYWLNAVSYGHLGYAVGERYLRLRRGWLNRATYLVPIRNLQTVVVRQNPFDRRYGVGTLMVDTAGQAYTGGGPRVRNVPLDEAIALARGLAHGAAQTRYRW